MHVPSPPRALPSFSPTGLIALHSFVAAGAIVGGLALVLEPRGSLMGFPVRWLDGLPCCTYLLPGLGLIVAVGGSMLGAALGLSLGKRWATTASIVAGLILALWVTAEVALIGFLHWFQLAHFGLGLTAAAVAARPRVRLRPAR
jgi:hypothetical protein